MTRSTVRPPDGDADDRSAIEGHELLDPAVREIRTYLDSRRPPDLTAAIMRRIAAERPPANEPGNIVARVGEFLWAPRMISVRLRPAHALLVAALLAGITVSGPRWRSAGPSPAAPSTTRILVQFRLDSSHATSVRLAGSFTNWQPEYDLQERIPGVWTLTLPLSPGVHDYNFVVDGHEWVPDPSAPQVDDGFGGTNSRLVLPPPERS
jgi:hypothetical protein